MKIITFLLIAFTITNGIFIFLMNEALEKHQTVIDRQGSVLTLMLETPEIKAALNKKLTEEGQPTY